MLICLQIAIGLAALYLLLIVAPALLSSYFVFRPQRSRYTDLASLDGTYYQPYREEIGACAEYLRRIPSRPVTVLGSDGTPLHADYYENGTSDRVILFFHGYRTTPMMSFAVQAKALYEQGYNLAFIYERSHNGLEGRRIGYGILERHDVVSWCRYFRDETANRAAALYGSSMGSTAVAYASDRLDPAFVKTLVLDCGFLSVYGQMERESRKRHLPTGMLMPHVRFAARLLLREDIAEPTVPHLARCAVPKLFLHGTADRTVDYRDTSEAYDRCTSEKQLLLVDGAEHTASVLRGKERVLTALTNFIAQYLEA